MTQPLYLDYLYGQVKDEATSPGETAAWERLLALLRAAQEDDPPTGVDIDPTVVVLRSRQQCRLTSSGMLRMPDRSGGVSINVPPRRQSSTESYSVPLQ